MRLLDAELQVPTAKAAFWCACFACLAIIAAWIAHATLHSTVLAWCGGFVGALLIESGLSPSKSPRAFATALLMLGTLGLAVVLTA